MSMTKRLFYIFVKNLSRYGLPIFFKRLRIEGLDRLPKDRAYILAPNHQNAFIDAMLLGSFADRPVHYLTRSDVFGDGFFRWVLNALNMWPVYRMRDGIDQLAKNDETFAKCERLLQNKGALLIFPEANTQKHHYLRSLSKGTARLAMQTQLKMDEELYVVPVGINYFDHDRPRHPLYLSIGEPIDISTYRAQHDEHPARAINQLRKDMTQGLHAELLLPDNGEYYPQQKSTISTLRSDWTSADIAAIRSGDRVADYPAPRRDLWSMLLSLPNLPLLWLIRYVIRTKVKDDQFVLSLKFGFGIFLFPIYWLLIAGLLAYLFSWQIGGGALLVMISTLFLYEDYRYRK